MTDKIFKDHPLLYHYTTIGGLKGIIENKSLWATHCQYLNDKSEMKIAADILFNRFLPEIIKKCSDIEHIKKHPEKIPIIQERVMRYIFVTYQVLGNDFFITSFCGQHKREYDNKEGLLSQWRGYGREQGCRLTFDTQELFKLLDKDSPNHAYSYGGLGDVVYNGKENIPKLEEELSEQLNVVLKECQEIIKADLEGNALPDSGEDKELYNSIVQIITLIKHESFWEENEVRFVARPYISKEYVKGKKLQEQKSIQFPPEKKVYIRNNAIGNPVPYIILMEDSRTILPIKEILIGPGHHKQKNADALLMWLSSFKDERSKINVKVSKTPFV